MARSRNPFGLFVAVLVTILLLLLIKSIADILLLFFIAVLFSLYLQAFTDFLEKRLDLPRVAGLSADRSEVILKVVNAGEHSMATAVALDPVLEISKMYVLPGHHGTGVSSALMHAALEHARTSASRADGSASASWSR